MKILHQKKMMILSSLAICLGSLISFALYKTYVTINLLQKLSGESFSIGHTTLDLQAIHFESVSLSRPISFTAKKVSKALSFSTQGQTLKISEPHIQMSLEQLTNALEADSISQQNHFASRKEGHNFSAIQNLKYFKTIELLEGDLLVRQSSHIDGKSLRLMGLNAQISPKENDIQLEIRRLEFESIQLENISAQIIKMNDGRLKFIIANGGFKNPKTWEIKGSFDRSSGGKGFLKTSQIDSNIIERLRPYFQLNPDLAAVVRFDIRFDSKTETIRFGAHLGTVNLKLSHPMLASQEIGPIAARLKLGGRLNLKNGFLNIQNGTLAIKNLNQLEQDHDLTTYFDLYHPNILESLSSEPFHLAFRTPRTSCQKAIDYLPLGIADQLKSFKLKGHFALKSEVSFSIDEPELFSLQTPKSFFNCRIVETSPAFSRARFRTSIPQNISPRQDKNSKLISSFQSDSYTPISEIAPQMLFALIASEDSGFWRHPGYEWESMQNALRANLKNKKIIWGLFSLR